MMYFVAGAANTDSLIEAHRELFARINIGPGVKLPDHTAGFFLDGWEFKQPFGATRTFHPTTFAALCKKRTVLQSTVTCN